MKPAIYLTDPAEMRRVRLNQPRVSSAQFRAQLLACGTRKNTAPWAPNP